MNAAETQELIDLLTPIELARELRITPQTVSVWHRKGIIPSAYACGRVIRFNRDAVHAALAAQSKRRAAK